MENAIFGRDSHDAPFSKCKVEVHNILLPKPSIFHQSYSIDANTIQGLLIYICLRVLKWLVAYLFEVCGVLIKFLLKKWTFGQKKCHFVQICPKWCSNQEWPFIYSDTVFQELYCDAKKNFPKELLRSI